MKTRITHTPPENLFQRRLPLWKRAMDIFGAITALTIFAPVMGAAALYIKLTSPGPVFFRQERLGYLGRKFTIYKFRTMRTDGDAATHRDHVVSLIAEDSNALGHNGGRPMAKLANDARIIRGGHILRKSHIDELPQLFNVLRGEMSLVGPRPPIAYEVQAYAQWHAARLDALPGMTGLWQVSGKNQTTFREMVRFDIRYARDRSMWLDLRILFRTCLVIINQLRGSGVENEGGDAEQLPHRA